MKKTALRSRPPLMLLWLACVMALSAGATTSSRATLTSCPKPQPASSNVMQPPSAEKSLRAELFESAATQTTNTEPAKLSSPQIVPR